MLVLMKMAIVIFTTVSLIFSFVLKSCASNPAAVNPRSTTVMEGTNVTLHCTIIKNSSETVGWTTSHSLSLLSEGKRIRKEGLVSKSQYDRLWISGNSDLGEYNLNFHNVQPEDAGQYSCGYFSVSQRQAIFSPKAVLTVILPPVCEHFPKILELAPGDSIQMVCRSQNNRPNTALTWLRNGQLLRGTRNSQAELSNTISYVLTEDDYDQSFTCIENMSPFSYVPHCSITPLRQTRKPVHIANSPEVVTVGGISHLTCLINQSFDSLSYRWLVDSNLVSSTSKIYSFGPVSLSDNGTSIICEVHRDGELYGRDEIVIIVTTEPEEATYMFGPVIVNTTPSRTSFEMSTYTHGGLIEEGTGGTSETFILNSIEDNVIIIIVLGALGVLLIIAVCCVTIFIIRHKEFLNRYTGSKENTDTSSTVKMRELSDFDAYRTFVDPNVMNENMEAQKSLPPHRHNLEPDASSLERKERRDNLQMEGSAEMMYDRSSYDSRQGSTTQSPITGYLPMKGSTEMMYSRRLYDSHQRFTDQSPEDYLPTEGAAEKMYDRRIYDSHKEFTTQSLIKVEDAHYYSIESKPMSSK